MWLHCKRPCQALLYWLYQVYSIQNTEGKPTFRQLCFTKIPKPALYCLLFHDLFPYSLPSFCGLDWLCYTQCANVQEKSQMRALHKNTTLLCGERQARHTLYTFHMADTQSLSCVSVCVCNHTDESRGRLAG